MYGVFCAIHYEEDDSDYSLIATFDLEKEALSYCLAEQKEAHDKGFGMTLSYFVEPYTAPPHNPKITKK